MLAPQRCDPTAHVDPAAHIGEGTVIGPHAMIGPDVRIGKNCLIGASVVIDGRTQIGDETQIFPMASIGLAPQDLKYRGEQTALRIGRRNIFREFVTINRGTAGGGGETTIGNENLFMAYVHVAHDCHVGSGTIFGPHATLGGHVGVEDFANVSAGSAVHQFCRVGRYGFIGGYSVVTKDALPFGRTIGSRPARVYRRELDRAVAPRLHAGHDRAAKLAYRYLLQSKLNTTQALAQIEQDEALSAPEVRYLVEFIRTSQRGVILRRSTRRAEELVADELSSSSGSRFVSRGFVFMVQRVRAEPGTRIIELSRELNTNIEPGTELADWSDCRQRPVSVSRPRCGAGNGPRRHDRRREGGGVLRAERRRQAARAPRFTGSRSVNSGRAFVCCEKPAPREP